MIYLNQGDLNRCFFLYQNVHLQRPSKHLLLKIPNTVSKFPAVKPVEMQSSVLTDLWEWTIMQFTREGTPKMYIFVPKDIFLGMCFCGIVLFLVNFWKCGWIWALKSSKMCIPTGRSIWNRQFFLTPIKDLLKTGSKIQKLKTTYFFDVLQGRQFLFCILFSTQKFSTFHPIFPETKNFVEFLSFFLYFFLAQWFRMRVAVDSQPNICRPSIRQS